MQTSIVRRLATGLVLIATFPAGGLAAEADRATLRATGTAGPPAGAAVAVDARDGGERTRLLLPEIEDALRARGFAVSAEAAWRLSVATAVTAEPPGRGPFRVYGTLGSSSRADMAVEVPLPQWPGPRQEAPFYRYNVAMTLGRAGRPATWQGAASAVLATADALAIERTLATALIAHLGETVADVPVPID